MFLRSLFKLNNSISFHSEILEFCLQIQMQTKLVLFQSGISEVRPQIQVKTKTKRSSPYSSSVSVRNFGFLVAKWVSLAKKPRGRDIFCPL